MFYLMLDSEEIFEFSVSFFFDLSLPRVLFLKSLTSIISILYILGN